MPLLPHLSSIFDQKHLLARFWKSASRAWEARKGWVIGMAFILLLLVLLQLLVQFLLNVWNRNFFDALERRDANTIWVQAQLFLPLVAASILLASTAVWARMTTQRYWREALTRHVLNQWLENERYHRLNEMVKGSENPEYRIAVDIRTSTDAPVDLAYAFLSSILTSITFFGVLWEVGGSIDLFVFGRNVTVPGYLVFGVIAYSFCVSSFMIFIGHHLTPVIERMNQAEAELREAADAFRENRREHIVATEAEKRDNLWLRLQTVLRRWRSLAWQLARVTFVSQGNVLLAPVVAWFLCAPKFLSGAMSLGELTQAAAAFVTVQGAVNWLVDNYQRLSDWRSAAHRVATLLLALDDIEAAEAREKSAPQRSVSETVRP